MDNIYEPQMITPTKPLKLALAETGAAIKPRSVLPILSCVRLRTNDGMLELSTSSLDAWITRLVPCEGGLPSLCTPHYKLKQVIEQCGESVSLEVEDFRLLVKSGNTKTWLPIIPESEFPTERFGEMKQVPVNAPEIANGIEAVSWAADWMDLKPVAYANILIKLTPTDTYCVATKSTVCAMYRTGWISAKMEIVIPAPLAELLIPVLRGEHADLSLSENFAIARNLNGMAAVKLSAEKYLKWEGITQMYAARDGLKGVDISSELLKKACLMAVIVNGANETPALELSQEGGVLTLRSGNDDYFETVASEGEPQKGCFNAIYLTAALPKLNSDTVKFVGTENGVFFEGGNLTVAIGRLPSKAR